MTPKAFKGLQAPYASIIGQLLGFNITDPSGQNVNPVQFSYPGGKFQGTGGSTAAQQTSAGQRVRLSGTSPTSGGDGGWVTRPGGVQQATNSSPGFTLTNPNLGTGNPNDILNGIPTYDGPLTADLGANEQSILDMLMGASGAGSSSSGTALDPATAAFLQSVMGPGYVPGNTTPQGLQQFAQGYEGAHATAAYDPNSENPFLAAAIEAAQRPTMQALTETLSRTLPGRFTQGGQFTQPQGSSAFDRAAAIATRGAGDTMGDIATKLSYQTTADQLGRNFQAQQAARGAEDTALQGQLARDQESKEGAASRQIQAAGIAPQVSQAQVQNLTANLQAQALPRLIQEYGIERGMDEFNNRMNSLLSVIGIAGGVTQPTVSSKSESSQAGVSLK
jgi:uncharacterized membrane protein